jgi:formylglycine-generating enzyme required for sulfatase activity
MRRWFLSYHSPDQPLAERLKAAIERKDSASRVFFAPTHLRAGGSWTAQLAQEIAQATAFILLVGEHGLGDWQIYEYDEALDRRVKSADFPVILVLLDGQTAPGLPFLRRLHWIISPDPASEKDVARLFDAASGVGSNPGELWRHTSPYRGLEAMQEKDADYFFGRTSETIRVLRSLSSTPRRLPVIIGNSGVGKSSLAQAGVLAALKRQAWPEETQSPNAWPAVFHDSRQWCYLSLKPGADPLKALVDSFLDTWQFAATDFERIKQQNGFIELLRDGKATLSDLIDATERRRRELAQPEPPAFLLYVDQGEELYARAEEQQRRCFSELLAKALPDPRFNVMMSMRSDFLGHLQSDQPIFEAREQIDVAPLREAELHEVVSRPAELLGARFEPRELVEIITRRTAEDSTKDVGALPLLSYTLDDMWTQMVEVGDGALRLPVQSFELGGVLVERANKFLETHPGTEDALRRVLTLRLAAVRDDGEPTRRRAARAEFSSEEWQLVNELANFPNRLLVTVTTETEGTYAEVAHEAIFKRWAKLREWIAAEREFLAWRTGLDAAVRTWQAHPPEAKRGALLTGHALAQAQYWLAKRASDIAADDRTFIAASNKAEQWRRTRVRSLVGALVIVFAAGLTAYVKHDALTRYLHWLKDTRPFMMSQFQPHVLKAAAESALKPGQMFRECADERGQDYCPQMIVVPAGSFVMGSPITEKDRDSNEGPQHNVKIARHFAVSKFPVTFAEWDTCVTHGECEYVSDVQWGRGKRPVIYVTWGQAKQYVAWLSQMTGQHYRLLSEAEYEYSVRAGTQTAFPWGDEIGHNNAHCKDCGSTWGNRTAPVDSYPANRFGLVEMVGNVWEWVEDCYNPRYKVMTPQGEVSAPTDGSAWTSGDCSFHVVRGGSWVTESKDLRSARRDRTANDGKNFNLGFRVARSLKP